MRKLIFLMMMIACLSLESRAQAYREGMLQVNAGISTGLIGYGGFWGSTFLGLGGFQRTGFIPLWASVEYGFHRYVSAGPYVGYYARGYRNQALDYHHRWNFLSFGARGTFHGTSLMNDLFDWDIDEDRWDIYTSLLLGAELTNYDYRYGGGFNGALIDEGSTTTTRFIGGFVLGGRYMFNQTVGVFAETGRGVFGWANLGVTFNL